MKKKIEEKGEFLKPKLYGEISIHVPKPQSDNRHLRLQPL